MSDDNPIRELIVGYALALDRGDIEDCVRDGPSDGPEVASS
ncbi:hypothetical protein [Mycobacterium sherrisii]|nr:hypothetical protein [Mycobacterium sherrisii]